MDTESNIRECKAFIVPFISSRPEALIISLKNTMNFDEYLFSDPKCQQILNEQLIDILNLKKYSLEGTYLPASEILVDNDGDYNINQIYDMLDTGGYKIFKINAIYKRCENNISCLIQLRKRNYNYLKNHFIIWVCMTELIKLIPNFALSMSLLKRKLEHYEEETIILLNLFLSHY